MKKKLSIIFFVIAAIGVFGTVVVMRSGQKKCPEGTVLDKELSNSVRVYCMSDKINSKSYQTEYHLSKPSQIKCHFELMLIEHCPTCVNKTHYVLTGNQQCWYQNGKQFFSLETTNNKLTGKGTVWRDNGELWFTFEKAGTKDFDLQVTYGSTIDGINKDLGNALIGKLMSGYSDDWKSDGTKEEVDIVKLSRMADKFTE